MVLVAPGAARPPSSRPPGGGQGVVQAGSVTEGTTVCDFDEARSGNSARRGLAVASLAYDGIMSTSSTPPGYADFVGELRAGLRAADCALSVTVANEGVDEPTKSLWQECSQGMACCPARGGHHR